MVEIDLHQWFGIDIDDREMLRRRTWRWLSSRILGLLSVESRLRRDLYPDDDQEG